MCCAQSQGCLLPVIADVNTEIEILKNAVVKMVKAGQPVFFGCDVGQFSDRDLGIMDTALFEYEVRIKTLVLSLINPLPKFADRAISLHSISLWAFRRRTACGQASRP